ncbi:MAG: hypothetical protein ACYTFK_04075 [Planctomycetota bacterium]
MPYTVRYDSACDCIFAAMEGDIDMEMLRKFGKEIKTQQSEHDCKQILNDLQKAKIKLSTVQIYDLPKFIESIGLDRSTKRAIIVSQDLENSHFFETVSYNVGHLVKVFVFTNKSSYLQKVQEAKSWLGLPTEDTD